MGIGMVYKQRTFLFISSRYKSRVRLWGRYKAVVRSCHPCSSLRLLSRCPGLLRFDLEPACTPVLGQTALTQTPKIKIENIFKHKNRKFLVHKIMNSEYKNYLICWQQLEIIRRVGNNISFTACITWRTRISKPIQSNAQHSELLESGHKKVTVLARLPELC